MDALDGRSPFTWLKPRGYDIDTAAGETWRTNFVHSPCFYADFYSRPSLPDSDVQVDTAHRHANHSVLRIHDHTTNS